MDVTADTLLNQVSTLLLDKIDKQNIDPNFLKGFIDTLLKKFTYKDTGAIKQVFNESETKKKSSPTKGIVKDIKRAYKELLKDQSYITEYKKFLEKVFPVIALPEPSPPPVPLTTSIDNTKNVTNNTYKEDNTKNVTNNTYKEDNTKNVTNNTYKEDNTKNVTNNTYKEDNTKNVTNNTYKEDNTNNAYNVNNYNQEEKENRLDLIKEETKTQVVLLGGITDNGYKDLQEKLPKLFKDLIPKQIEQKKTSEKGLFGEISDSFKSMTSVLGTLGPALIKIAGPVAAIAGGEIIGGAIGQVLGEFLYGEEGKEAYEKYGTGITGLTKAAIDLYKQGQEARQQQEEHQQMSQERIKRSAEPLEGKVQYDPKNEEKLLKQVNELRDREKLFKQQYEELKAQSMEGWNPFADEQKETEARMNWEGAQETLIIAQNKLQELRKLKTSTSEQPKPPVSLKDGGLVIPQNNKPTIASIAEPGNPEFVIPLDKMFDISNSSLNSPTLSQIASNTKDTNKALNGLTDAIIRMVGAFNQKMSTQGSTTVINAGGGSKDYTSASMAANLNSDPIRRVRAQFAV